MDDERRGKISKIKLSSEKIDPVPPADSSGTAIQKAFQGL